jgi:alanine dehydrogenase
MKIGVPKEIKAQEYRVALSPSAAYQLNQRGHHVMVERNAGAGSGFPDDDYRAAGAELVTEPEQIFAEASLVVKAKEPQRNWSRNRSRFLPRPAWW